MSILIKGMEMPKRGHTVTITIVGSGEAYVEYYDCKPSVNETIEYKVFSLPEGHGDLMDKQAFIADIAGFIECMTNVGVMADGEMLWGKLLDALANAKTVVPAEGGTENAP